MFKEDVADRSSFNNVGNVVNLEDQQVAMSISVDNYHGIWIVISDV
jgi:hypothetical protein